MYGWGWLAWNLGADLLSPHPVDALNDLTGVKHLACSVTCVHILTTDGRLFVLKYNSEMQVGRTIRYTVSVYENMLSK